MDSLAHFILKEHGKMKGERVNWESHWQEVTEVMSPRKSDVFDFNFKIHGEKKSQKMYDSTAQLANNLLASALQGMLTNPAAQWFELSTGDPEVDKQREVKQWLQKATRVLLDILNNSNFHQEMHEIYIDLGCFGTSVLRVEEDKNDVVRFHSRPIYEHWIKEDSRGMVDTVSRELKMTGRQLLQEFDFEKIEIEEHKLYSIKKDLDKEWTLIHWVGPKEDLKEGVPQKSKRFKISSVKVIKDLDVVVEFKGFEEFPYVVSRWTKTSSEVYGRSPAIEALPDIQMLQAMMKTTIRNAEKIVDPPLQIPDDGMLLPIRTIPGGLNYYRAGTKDQIVPLNTGGDIRLSKEIIDDVRMRIDKAFFVDQLRLVENDRMTATEVLQRTEEKLRVMGPVLGRQSFELLKPLITRILGIATRAGKMPKNAPTILRDKDIRMEFSSPIARAQKATEADNINRVIGLVAPIAQGDPTILDNIDGDGYIRFLGNLFNVPQEMFKSERDVKQIRQVRAQQQQQQMQVEQQAQLARAAKDVGIQANQG